MTQQDADGDSDTASTDEQSAADAPESASEEGDSESLEEIAEKPAGDIDEVLSAITDDDAELGANASFDAAVTPEDVSVDDSLVELVEETSPEKLAHGIATLNAELAETEATLEETREEAEDLESRLKRKQADFQNYKKRQQKRLKEEKQRATEDLVKRLVDVRDNLARALDQDEDTDIRSGVESTLEQFNQELDKENVEVIEPSVGTDVDPNRHEVLATIGSDQPEDTIADLHRPGYEMAGKVIRAAQVAVSDGSAHDETTDEQNDEQNDE